MSHLFIYFNTLCFCFSDKPGPIQHLRVSDIRSDSAYLSWKDPEDNGGARITNFVVEKKDTASTQWVPVCSTSKKRSMMLKHLMEGTSYSFRVAAENQYGRSEYVETPKAIKAMNPLCELHPNFKSNLIIFSRIGFPSPAQNWVLIKY